MRLPGTSFCLITDGRRPERLREELASIRALDLPAAEIIVAGDVPVDLGDDVHRVFTPELAHAGRLGAMRNRACAVARYDQLVVADDDMIFHPEFRDVVLTMRNDADVVCVRLQNPDGTRFWDWATHGGPRGHVLLDYGETDESVYVTGGLAVMRAAVHDAVPWSDALGFYHGEDVEWSARVRAAGFRIGFDERGRVTHQDSRYTQQGRALRFTQDLTAPERLVPGVVALGVFRAGHDRVRGSRWMSERATITAPLATSHERVVRFTLSSLAPPLATSPFHVTVVVNDVMAGVARFEGAQSCTLAFPLQDATTTTIALESELAAAATSVGIDDDRLVSVLIHDTQLAAD